MRSTVYIAGLGGQKSIRNQRALVSVLNVFRKQDSKIAFFDPLWETSEPYADKFERLRDFHESHGRPVNVLGISAGASLAVRLCTEVDDDTSLHLVCGKILGSEKIGTEYRRRAPAFLESVQHSERLASRLDCSSTTCYVPKNEADGVIESVDMSPDGCKVINLPELSHAKAIGYWLLRYLPTL